MSQVILKNISKSYDGKTKSVNDVNLTINDKEFVVLVGPSGCGKSTTLRMIAGLEEITEGQIILDKKVINDVPPKDRDIAMVFQNYALYPHMTVYENMAFGLKLRKLNKDEIKIRVTEAAKVLDLMDYLNRKPKTLSGGQRQRVAVGRAIVRKPKVFLFDEPLSNLDAKLRVQMRTEISKLHKKLNATIIYVTHDQIEAMTMGTKIVVMKDGLVQQVGSPAALYNNPANKFVAGFIGSPAMNFIETTVIESNGIQLQLVNSEIKLNMPEWHKERFKNLIGKNIIVGLRPEEIRLEPAGNNYQPVNVKIELIEPMGYESFIYFMIGDIQFTGRVNSITIKNDEKLSTLYFNTSKFYFFDKESERSID
jgi:multiple sugar transport system ATP-binding protein